MDFEQLTVLYLLIPVVVLWFFIHHKDNNIEALFAPDVLQKISLNKHRLTLKTRLRLLLLAMALIVFGLAQPTLDRGEIKVNRTLSDLLIAVDMSQSMLANDIYPNRFEFAKNKLLTTFDNITGKRVAMVGFSSQSFLISPLTEDFSSLKFLINNLRLDALHLKGTNIMSLLQSANDLFGQSTNKQILLLTDGGDKTNFDEEAAYAKAQNLQIFVFDVASERGGSIRTENGLLKDDNKNIVYVRENPNIKMLSVQSRGNYLKYSLNNDDLLNFINTFKSHGNSQEISIKQKQQLFYYPLMLTLVLLFFAFFSSPQRP